MLFQRFAAEYNVPLVNPQQGDHFHFLQKVGKTTTILQKICVFSNISAKKICVFSKISAKKICVFSEIFGSASNLGTSCTSSRRIQYRSSSIILALMCLQRVSGSLSSEFSISSSAIWMISYEDFLAILPLFLRKISDSWCLKVFFYGYFR